jgi:hypothetical protein
MPVRTRPADLRERDGMLIRVTRRWREARDKALPAQPILARLLDHGDGAVLAPVYDSLLRLYELALGRPIRTGKQVLSIDEARLIGLLDGTLAPRHCAACPRAMANAFDCALCSARVMIGLSSGGEAPVPRRS